MKANEILKALQCGKPNKQQKEHAAKLAAIYTLIRSISQDVVSVEIESKPFDFGHRVDLGRNYNSDLTHYEGTILPGELWTVKTKTGTYKNSIPTGNDFYFAFCDLLQGFAPKVERAAIVADQVLQLDEVQTLAVKTAAKFIKFDKFADARNCVHITISGGKFEVMGTDGYKLFRSVSSPLQTNLQDQVILLPLEVVKSAKGKTLQFDLIKNQVGEIKAGYLNGVKFEVPDYKPLPYNNVIPEYSEYVEVFRKDLLQAVKSVLPTANKTTKVIKFHFNGAVMLTAEDLDYSSESGVKVGYLEKTTPDFEIGMNGKFLLEALSVIDTDTVKIYSAGENNRCVMLNKEALLMPVMLNQYA